MATPKTVDEWIERLTELSKSLNADSDTVAKAYAGNAAAKATIQAWAVELQAAAVFVASAQGGLQANVETMVEVANILIDTAQAILLALGIVWLLKKIRKKNSKEPAVEIKVVEAKVREALGNRTKPIPSRADGPSEKTKEAEYLRLRAEWTTHFALSLVMGLKLQEELKGGKELIWKSRMDSTTCSICRFMHNKKSIKGDFLPVIMKQFPTYQAYVPWMGFPHAHPRCTCIAIVEGSD